MNEPNSGSLLFHLIASQVDGLDEDTKREALRQINDAVLSVNHYCGNNIFISNEATKAQSSDTAEEQLNRSHRKLINKINKNNQDLEFTLWPLSRGADMHNVLFTLFEIYSEPESSAQRERIDKLIDGYAKRTNHKFSHNPEYNVVQMQRQVHNYITNGQKQSEEEFQKNRINCQLVENKEYRYTRVMDLLFHAIMKQLKANELTISLELRDLVRLFLNYIDSCAHYAGYVVVKNRADIINLFIAK